MQKQRKNPEETKGTPKNRLLQRARYIEKVMSLRPIDDTLGTKMFENAGIDCTKLLVNTIVGKDLNITSCTTQCTMSNLQGRGMRLDVYTESSQNDILCGIEFQIDNEGASAKRARFNSSLMDANFSKKGEKHKELPETYTIFITEHDVFGAGLPIYHVERYVTETGKRFKDDAHIIYVNTDYQDENSDLGKLIHDLKCQNPEDMYYPEFANRMAYLKSNKKEVNTMCRAVTELVDEALTKVSVNLAREGIDVETISTATQLPIEVVEQLLTERNIPIIHKH